LEHQAECETVARLTVIARMYVESGFAQIEPREAISWPIECAIADLPQLNRIMRTMTPEDK
jgi:hypothetical protein